MKTILNFTNICSKQFLKDFAGAGQIQKKTGKRQKRIEAEDTFSAQKAKK